MHTRPDVLGLAIRSLIGLCAVVLACGVSVSAASAEVRGEADGSVVSEAADAAPDQPVESVDSSPQIPQYPVYLPGPEYMVNNLHIVSFGPGTADISWDRPSFEDPRITFNPHLITVNGEYVETCPPEFFDSCWWSSRTPYTLEDLRPGQSYTVTVTAGFSRGPDGGMTFAYGDPAELTFLMPDIAPPTEERIVEEPSESSEPLEANPPSDDAQVDLAGVQSKPAGAKQAELAATGSSTSQLMWVALGCVILGGAALWFRRFVGVARGTHA